MKYWIGAMYGWLACLLVMYAIARLSTHFQCLL